MTEGERNYRLLQKIDANRRLLLTAYIQNPELLAHAEPRIQQLLGWPNPQQAAGNKSNSGA